jgi:excisionase family DNA binding protein
MKEELYTIPEAADILKIGLRTLRRYLSRRLIRKVVLPGNDQRIRKSDLDKFIDDRTV